jgi:hypothetical protein
MTALVFKALIAEYLKDNNATAAASVRVSKK